MSSFKINLSKFSDVVFEFGKRLIGSVIERSRVNIKDTSGSLGMIAAEC
jgi:hypothetical protein